MRTTAARRVVTVIGALVLTMAMALPASAKVEIHRVVYDPPGADTRANSQLNKEMVVLRNTGAKTRRLGNWLIRDAAGHRYKLPAGFQLGPNRYVRVHTGKGTSHGNDLFWNSGWYVWNNNGDRATLKNAAGKVIDRCRYRGGGSAVNC